VGGGGFSGARFLIYSIDGPDGISFREFIFVWQIGTSRSTRINCTLFYFLQNRYDKVGCYYNCFAINTFCVD